MLYPTEAGRALESDLDNEYQGTGDLARTLTKYDPVLAQHARYLSQFGKSWRGFLVGGNVPALVLEDWATQLSLEQLFRMGVPVGRLALLEGANNSPNKGDERDCPEMSFSAKGDEMNRRIGRTVFMHLYTAGPGDPAEISTVTGLQTDTLPPCDACRPMLWDCAATWPGMPVTTQAHDGPAREDHTLQGLVVAYADTEPPLPSAALLPRLPS